MLVRYRIKVAPTSTQPGSSTSSPPALGGIFGGTISTHPVVSDVTVGTVESIWQTLGAARLVAIAGVMFGAVVGSRQRETTEHPASRRGRVFAEPSIQLAPAATTAWHVAAFTAGHWQVAEASRPAQRGCRGNADQSLHPFTFAARTAWLLVRPADKDFSGLMTRLTFEFVEWHRKHAWRWQTNLEMNELTDGDAPGDERRYTGTSGSF